MRLNLGPTAILIPLSCALVTATIGCPKLVTLGGAPVSASATTGLKIDPNLKAGQGPVAAEIGDTKLTIGDLESRLNQRGGFERMQYKNPEKRQEFLDHEVKFELLAQEAFATGMHEDPNIMYQLKRILVQKLTRGQLDSNRSAEALSDTELKTYYDAHAEEYSNPQLYRYSIIRIGEGLAEKADEDKKQAAEVRKFASNPQLLEDIKHFRKLVGKYSTHASSKRLGGDIKFVSQDELKKTYGDALTAGVWDLEKNAVSDVLKGSDNAYYVVKKTGERAPRTRTFDDMKKQLTNLLRREKREKAFSDYIESLRAKFGVKLHPETLKDMKVNTDAIPPHAGDHGMVGGANPLDITHSGHQ